VLIIRRSKLYYTASGIITPVGSRPVHRLREKRRREENRREEKQREDKRSEENRSLLSTCAPDGHLQM